MFGCCCKSSNKGVLFAAIVGAAATIGAAYYATNLTKDADESAAEPAEVVPAVHQPEVEMSEEDIMKMMAEWSALAPEHEVLKGMEGTWDCEAKFWMEPGEDPTIGHGTSENQLIMGGRYVTQHFVMPDFMGMDFEGMGAIGYDKQKEKFVNVWIDNMSTGMMIMTGEWDKDSHTMTWVGTAATPMGESEMKHIIKDVNEDKTVMEFWESNQFTGGEFMKTGEITYTRSK